MAHYCADTYLIQIRPAVQIMIIICKPIVVFIEVPKLPDLFGHQQQRSWPSRGNIKCRTFVLIVAPHSGATSIVIVRDATHSLSAIRMLLGAFALFDSICFCGEHGTVGNRSEQVRCNYNSGNGVAQPFPHSRINIT